MHLVCSNTEKIEEMYPKNRRVISILHRENWKRFEYSRLIIEIARRFLGCISSIFFLCKSTRWFSISLRWNKQNMWIKIPKIPSWNFNCGLSLLWGLFFSMSRPCRSGETEENSASPLLSKIHYLSQFSRVLAEFSLFHQLSASPLLR